MRRLSLSLLFSVVSLLIATNVSAQESPYSFATGKRVAIEKDEGAVREISENFVESLKGTRGTMLSLAAAGLTAVTFMTGLRAAAYTCGILTIALLAISHPLLALFFAACGLIYHKFRSQDEDESIVRPKKEGEKTEANTDSLKQINPTGSAATKAESVSTPKISRPL